MVEGPDLGFMTSPGSSGLRQVFLFQYLASKSSPSAESNFRLKILVKFMFKVQLQNQVPCPKSGPMN